MSSVSQVICQAMHVVSTLTTYREHVSKTRGSVGAARSQPHRRMQLVNFNQLFVEIPILYGLMANFSDC